MPAPITTRDMLDELRREIALRERVYPAWVAKMTLKQKDADWRLAVLRAVLTRIEETLSYEEARGGARA